METFGIVCTKVLDNGLVAEMPVTKANCQPLGMLHGGASLAFAESLAGCGTQVLKKGKCFGWGMQVSGSHISPVAIGETVVGTATILLAGRSIHVWDVNITAKSTGKLVAAIRVTEKIKEADSVVIK